METRVIRSQKLSLREKKSLEIQCNNRLKWTDGGHWMGVGKAPDCDTRERLKSKSSHTLTFPTDQSANKWNSEWEKVIRHGGYLASALLGLGTGFIATSTASFSVSVISGVVLGEAQASVIFPRMERGWSYEIIFEYDFSWSPHPFFGNRLIQTITGISRDHQGKEVLVNSNTQKYDLDQLPDGLGRLLASSPPKVTSSVYS